MNKLSIVIPVYYNEFNLPVLYEKLSETIFKRKQIEYELIFVDDGSGDNSYEVLKGLAEKDANIKLIKLSRNFGSHTAILAGLSHMTGDCATVVAADLQEPPEIINEMYEKWKDGHKVVLAVREDREESFIQKNISNLYYRMMQKYALPNMPQGGFDCFLIDKQVVELLKNIDEKNSTLMGQILWCGFSPEKIYYVRKKREIGKSRWTLAKKIKLFIDSFTAFSYTPIKAISVFGFIVAGASMVLMIFYFASRLLQQIDVEGWTSIMLAILFFSGVQLMTLGVIGEYLWRVLDESRNRPTFIVDEKVGIEDE